MSNIPHSSNHTDTISVLTDAVEKLLPPLLKVQAVTLIKKKLETELEPHSTRPTANFTELNTRGKIRESLHRGNMQIQNDENLLFRDIPIPIPIPKISSRTYESGSSTVQSESLFEYYLRLDLSLHDEIPESKNIEEDGNEEIKSKDGNSSRNCDMENNEKSLLMVVNSISQIILLNIDYEVFSQKLKTEENIRYVTIFLFLHFSASIP